MKAFIFDPLWDKLVTPELQAKLAGAGIETHISQQIAPLSSCTELFEGNDDRLLCLNPDYVSWNLSTDDYKDIPGLRAILGAATSFSWIDSVHADQAGLPICNIRNFSSEAVAEWAVMTAFNLARQIPRLIKNNFPLDFDKDYMEYRGIELRGKTAGIIGLGHIGTAIAKRCAGLGMNVVYWSLNSRSEEYTFVELADLMAQSDIIFPVVAVNEDTKRLLTEELLNTMKRSAIFVDVVELADHELVAAKVKDKKLFGFGFEAKPSTFNEYDGNVWAAPAYGWVTDSSMYSTVEKWVDNMVSASQNKFPNRVN